MIFNFDFMLDSRYCFLIVIILGEMFGLYEKHNKTYYRQIGGTGSFYFDNAFGDWKMTNDILFLDEGVDSTGTGDIFPPTNWTVNTRDMDWGIPDNDIKIVTGAEVTKYKPCQQVTIRYDGIPKMKRIERALGEP